MCECSLDEDATHVIPTESRDVERGMAVVDGMVILHKMQSTALGTVVDLRHNFNDLLPSATRDNDDIILVFGTYKDVSLKCGTIDARLQGRVQCSTRYMMKRPSNIKLLPLSGSSPTTRQRLT